jgi:uncharacterized paraquat-inducible protein A
MNGPPRTCDVYELRCHACQCVVELPTHTVKDNFCRCPRCDQSIEIRWRDVQ